MAEGKRVPTGVDSSTNAQEQLFQSSLPMEEALSEILRRFGGGRSGPGRVLDYREELSGLPEFYRRARYGSQRGNVLKFKPPAVTSDEDIELMLDRCEDVIAFVQSRVDAGRTGDVRPDPLAAAT